MSAHALLGPSGAHRWLNCTPSPRLEEKYEDQTSEFAEEGTAAHELGEAILTGSEAKMKEARASGYYCGEMEEAVQLYVDTVTEIFNAAKVRAGDADLMIEERLDFSTWVPEGFGTGDAVVIADGVLEVIDLKYGKGVPVSAVGNPQLRLYGLGAYATYSILYDIHTVRMTIVQPRLDNVSTDEISVDKLLEWADTEVRPKAQMAWNGEGEYVAGDHCKFCKAKATCRARAEKNLELAKQMFKKPPELDTYEIAEILYQIDDLIAWGNDVKDYALDQAENKGVRYPGWKLVEGRSNRKYTDKELVAELLKQHKYRVKDIYKQELLGITDMEKLLGKKTFDTILKDLIIKPPGKPKLAPDEDARPELNTASKAAEYFSIDNKEEQ